MCSRFENKETGLSIFKKLETEFGKIFRLITKDPVKSKNIAPNDIIISVSKSEQMFDIGSSVWGIKFDNRKDSPLIFNSRIETIVEKKFWSNLFAKRRCLIPATAFYEWKEINKVKIPHKISLKEEDFFFIASISAVIEDVPFASMITTIPNSTIKNIHNRMPVILSKQEGLAFLGENPESAVKLCRPLDDEKELSIEIAEELLTDRHRKALEK